MLKNFRLADWIFVAPIGIIGLCLGIYGFTTCTDCSATGIAHPASQIGLIQAAAYTIGFIKGVGGFPPDRSHIALFAAQILIPLVAFFGVLKYAVQTVRRDARVLLAQGLRNHTIICGLGETGRQIVESFCDTGRQVVVISQNIDASVAAQFEKRHIPVLDGDASRVGILKLAGIRRASALIIACGSDDANLEIGMRARDLLGRRGARPLKIMSELRSEWLFGLVKNQNASALGSGQGELSLFNLNADAARHLLRAPAFLPAAREKPTRPHILFAGFGQVATEILLRAARCNFAIPSHKLSATILDEIGEDAIGAAEAACSGIRQIADLEFLSCLFANEDVSWQRDAIAALKTHPPLAVIVAVTSDDVALNVAMRFRQLLDELGLFAVPVFVRIREQYRLGAFLSRMEARSLFRERFVAFGGLAQLTRPEALLDESLDILARASHAVWLRVNAGSDSPAAVPWEQLSEFNRQANRSLADYIPVRLRRCGLRLRQGREPAAELREDDVEKLAALEHWRWCVELRSMGWRYAAARDDYLKLHNRLVDWAGLPEDTRNQNRQITRLLPQIAEAANMCLVRDNLLFAEDLGGAEPSMAAPGIQLVLAVDPCEAAQMQRAQQAQAQGAKIWALLRPGVSPQHMRLPPDYVPQIEAFLDPEEWAALRHERIAP